jgi:uncharacterized protein
MLAVFTYLADWIVYTILKLDPAHNASKALHFFIEDTTKIMVLVLVMIYAIGVLRASLNMDVVRNYLQGKPKFVGFAAAAMFGAVTPFCSCSSIPMFLGFTAAGIPLGITMAFLITSPLINEVAVVLLGSLLGWQFTITYVLAGLGVGIIGGFMFDVLDEDTHLQPMALQARCAKNVNGTNNGDNDNNSNNGNNGNNGKNDNSAKGNHSGVVAPKLSFRDRHAFAKQEALEIFGRIWKWILIGVGLGAALHGFVPDNWIAGHLGSGSWWSVPAAVLLGIPLYSNASGMIPVLETLLSKGLPVGTGLALMMSTVGASFPEFILLKQVLKPKLLVRLFLFFLLAFTAIGWLINFLFN